MAKKLPLMQFSAVVIKHRGKDVLLIKKETGDPNTMRHILKEIVENGSYNFLGQILFTNRFNAIVKLRKMGLIP